jgi:hypothetical protein
MQVLLFSIIISRLIFKLSLCVRIIIIIIIIIIVTACMLNTGNRDDSNTVCDKNNTAVTTSQRNIRVALTGPCSQHISCSLDSFGFLSFICNECHWRVLHKLRGNDSKAVASCVDTLNYKAISLILIEMQLFRELQITQNTSWRVSN